MGDEEAGNNVRVMTRVRLFNKRETEISAKKGELLRPVVKMRDKTCAIIENTKDDAGFPIEKEREAFQFDECFWSMPMEQCATTNTYADQKFVYERSGLLALQAAVAGFNVCIFAYGQTGSGKTYSMLGAPGDEGISPRLVDDLFGTERNPMIKTVVECMFFEIYNEKARDLFNKKTKTGDYDAPKIRQHPTKGIFVEGLIRKETTGADQTKHLIDKGTKERAIAETKMNATSSRSHAVFQIQVTQNNAMKGTRTQATVNLVDLAGSEKIKMSGASGETLTEAKNINQSLSTLRRVIDTLIDNSTIRNKKHHKVPPFRESVLTYVLSDSLGGNSKTQMIATISPHEANIEDTLGTLRYALRAKAIVCSAKVNEEKSAAMMDAMKEEIMLLQMKLKDGKGGGGISVEVKKEIEEREKELKQMETQQEEMEVLLEEAKAKEIEMEAKLQEVDAAKQELSLAVNVQKKERFAAAFRAAFRLCGEKKTAEATNVELEQLRADRIQMTEQNAFLKKEFDILQTEHEAYRSTTEEKMDEMVKEMNSRDASISTLKRQVGNMQEDSNNLKTQNEVLRQKIQTSEGDKQEIEKRVQRLQSELIASNATIEREVAEREKMKLNNEEKVANLNAELDNTRKRKDKYKQMYMEANARQEASKTVVEALQSDRTSFLTALKAQQQVVEEQSAAVARMLTDRKGSDDKARSLEKKVTQKDDDIKFMGEALREYQNAASQWMYENHSVTQELERVQRMGETRMSPSPNNFSPSPNRQSSPRPGATATHHIDPVKRTNSYGRNPSSGSSPRWNAPGNR